MTAVLEFGIISLLISSIIIFWFAAMAMIQKKRRGPFFPFALQFSLVCLIAADLFTYPDFKYLDIFTYSLSIIIGATYLFFVRRENK